MRKRTWWHDPRSVLHRVGCGIDWEIIGSSSMSMGPSRPHDSVHFPKQTSFLPLIAVLIASAPRAMRGRKRGQVGRTRTTVLQPYTHQWLGTFSGPGNGNYRAELQQALHSTLYNLGKGIGQKASLG